VSEKREKVTVDDIIGLIKTEPTDSVEEVRKLRDGEKQFTTEDIDVDIHNIREVTIIKRFGVEMPQHIVCNLMNRYDKAITDLAEECDEMSNLLRQYEDTGRRMHNRNERLSRDWDRLCQHLVDMQLMTDDEILKVIMND